MLVVVVVVFVVVVVVVVVVFVVVVVVGRNMNFRKQLKETSRGVRNSTQIYAPLISCASKLKNIFVKIYSSKIFI